VVVVMMLVMKKMKTMVMTGIEVSPFRLLPKPQFWTGDRLGLGPQ